MSAILGIARTIKPQLGGGIGFGRPVSGPRETVSWEPALMRQSTFTLLASYSRPGKRFLSFGWNVRAGVVWEFKPYRIGDSASEPPEATIA